MRLTEKKVHLGLTTDDLEDIQAIIDSGFPAPAPLRCLNSRTTTKPISSRIDAIRFALRQVSHTLHVHNQGVTHE